MNFGDRIKSIRGGLTQADFAKKIDVHISTAQLYESGNIPKGDVLQRIRKEFGVNIDWLLTGEGEPYIKTPAEAGAYQKEESPGLTAREETPVYRVQKNHELVGEITPDEFALIRTLRICGDEYKKRLYIAATIRAENVIEEKKLEAQEKLKAKKDLEVLSTASIE